MPSRLTRRNFVRAGALLTASVALPQSLSATLHLPGRSGFPRDEADVRQLAMRALEAARAAGARHAEVRLSHFRERRIDIGNGWGGGPAGTTTSGRHPTERDAVAIGVRALSGGSWGFAASTVWTLDEAARLGSEAVGQARTTLRGGGAVELAPAPVVRDGRWTMPVEIDPFTVSRDEIADVLAGPVFARLHRWAGAMLDTTLNRMDTVFASSEGSYFAQTRFGAGVRLYIGLRPQGDEGAHARVRGMGLSYLFPLAGRGWEYISRGPLQEMIERHRDEMEEYMKLPLKAVEVGRYDVVLDASSTARLLSGTIGAATELDRALGGEANAGGTSYLGDPAAMLGREEVAAASVRVTANRSLVGGNATVKWDEEGVEAESFTLVEKGMLADYQTTRESPRWLAEPYARLKRPVRSHGCAGAASALDATHLARPNLRLEPGRETASFDDLVGGLANGVAVKEGIVDVDYNALNGLVVMDRDFPATKFYEVKRGKKVARLHLGGTGVMFRAPELWKAVARLGGAESVSPTAVAGVKGEPAQTTYHTVEAPPMRLRQVAVIDPTR
jgi:TldD protein